MNGNGSGASVDHLAVVVLFLNKSSTTCILQGYPGAAIVDNTGKQVTQATRTIRGYLGGEPSGVTGIPAVMLRPGASAKSTIEGVSTVQKGAAQAGCDPTTPYPRILVTPPNTRTPVPFTVSWPICESFDIHPVVPNT